MKPLSIQFSIMTILSLNLALGQDTAQVKLEKITVDIAPNNPYFEDWSGEILSPGNAFSLKCPIKKDYPENMMGKLIAEFEGNVIVEYDVKVCDGYEDDEIRRDFFINGVFSENFPKNCPVKAGDYEIIKYTIPTDKLPSDSPDGKFVIIGSIYETGNDPYLSVRYEGEVIHQ
ncbi:uncharacterized protein LOC130673229 isoform X2 [Microplitis mediator]|uniref:uncharacterized protein LOC130673229 isoform X2 n=1 Tax=Microplitis mediator TaxID=375433 RepID=UPI0025565EDA|nr:uncharacterized protein LOC130673229 isoform X2 [Microplitis mediator]